jgi:hypothetical protein
MTTAQAIPTDEAADEMAAVLSWHDNDAMAAITTLLADCRHLREQLSLAEGAMSPGMTRGWRPSYERG